jgi:glyoxylase-like metal-dependent hydrolase (beta-lactamase superfamily II)
MSESGKDYFDDGNASWQDQIYNEVSDILLGTWGDVLSFGDIRQFEVLLTGGVSSDIIGVFDVDGRTFDSGATFSATSSMTLVLLSVENLSNLDAD